jgi:hypothetical protein
MTEDEHVLILFRTVGQRGIVPKHPFSDRWYASIDNRRVIRRFSPSMGNAHPTRI